MARRVSEPVKVEATPAGEPLAFEWQGVTYRGEIIARWHLQDRWWERQAYSDRYYFRLMTPDLQVFELYCDMAVPWSSLWILDRVVD